MKPQLSLNEVKNPVIADICNPLISVEWRNAIDSWPIWGGTSPGGNEEEKSSENSGGSSNSSSNNGSGANGGQSNNGKNGNSSTTQVLDATQLLAQVQTLTTQNQQLSQENETFKQEKTNAERSQQTKEEQLQTDLNNKDVQLQKAMNLLTQKTLENALLTHKSYQWHDAGDALNSIKDNPDIKITLDVDKGLASIEGMDKAVKDLAEKKPWMLAKGPENSGDNNGGPTSANRPPAPSSGPPPAPNNGGQGSIKAKRDAMRSKYSSLRGSPVVRPGN